MTFAWLGGWNFHHGRPRVHSKGGGTHWHMKSTGPPEPRPAPGSIASRHCGGCSPTRWTTNSWPLRSSHKEMPVSCWCSRTWDSTSRLRLCARGRLVRTRRVGRAVLLELVPEPASEVWLRQVFNARSKSCRAAQRRQSSHMPQDFVELGASDWGGPMPNLGSGRQVPAGEIAPVVMESCGNLLGRPSLGLLSSCKRGWKWLSVGTRHVRAAYYIAKSSLAVDIHETN
jgi:hypothetical protein